MELSWGQRLAAYRPSKTLFFWSCIACIAATIFVGFKWGGWVTGGTAIDMAAKSAAGARANLAAEMCVTQFKKAADAGTQLAALKKTDSWMRGDFIAKGGWVTVPGVQKPVPGAADICAKDLADAAAPAPGGIGKDAGQRP